MFTDYGEILQLSQSKPLETFTVLLFVISISFHEPDNVSFLWTTYYEEMASKENLLDGGIKVTTG